MKKKNIIFLLFAFMCLIVSALSVNAVENLTFTDTEIYAGATTATKIIELSNGDYAVGYIRSSALYFKLCSLNGDDTLTCGSEKGITTSTTTNFDIIEDLTNNKIITISDFGGKGRYHIYDLDGTYTGFKEFNGGATKYVSAVQTNSTHFAIAYQDDADGDKGKLIICKLDGSSCGSEITMGGYSISYNKITKTSDETLVVIGYNSFSIAPGLYGRRYNLAGGNLNEFYINSKSVSYIDMIEGSDNKLKIVFTDEADSSKAKFLSCDLDGTNCGSEITFSDGAWYNSIKEFNERLYIQTSELTQSISVNMGLEGLDISTATIFEDNYVDWISSIISSTGKLLISYYDYTPTPRTVVSVATLETSAGITFNNPIQDQFLNDTSFLLNVSFSEITNSTYILNSGVETTLGTNTNETTASLTGIEGLNTIQVFTNTSGVLTNSSINFTIDTINPVISIIGETEFDTFEVNFSNLINVSDATSGINTCTIDLTYNESITNPTQYDKSLNCSDLTTFGAVGNYTGVITATDNAGNVETEVFNISIEPLIYINIFDSSANNVTDYKLTINSPNGVETILENANNPSNFSTIQNNLLDIGNYSIIFEKNGFLTSTFNLELNETSGDETYNYNVSDARILLYIRDQETNNIITGTNFTVEFVATVGATTTTTTGLVNITNSLFEEENYFVVVSNPDYQTETIYFDFTNREEIVLNAYMINSTNENLGIVFIKPVDNFGNPIVGASVQALQWDTSTSSYNLVSSSTTGSDGLGTLNVILNDKVYIFRAISEGVSVETESEIIDSTENGKTINIKLEGLAQEYEYLLENIITSASQVYNEETNTSTVTFDYSSSIGEIDVCINSYSSIRGTERLLTENCIEGESGSYILNFLINGSYLTVLKPEIKVNDIKYTITKFEFQPEGNFNEIMSDLGLEKFVVVLLFIAAIALGFMINNIFISSIAIAIFAGISLKLAPTILTKGIVAFVFFIAWAIVYGGTKSK